MQQVDCFVGEIRMFAGAFAPSGWAFCYGQSMSINANQILYSLIGTLYGGDGVTTFNLPDLRGRLAIGVGQGTGLTARAIASSGGATTVTVNEAQMPSHNHALRVSSAAANSSTPAPSVTFGAVQSPLRFYIDTSQPMSGTQDYAANAISNTGGGQAHGNVMPSTATSYIIALEGFYPSFS